jgi:hypothetical protein
MIEAEDILTILIGAVFGFVGSGYLRRRRDRHQHWRS